jgi:D-alanine-D-alanine ligase
VEGREFNVALLAEDGTLCALPIAEMRFENWPSSKPRIVGYRAKWDEGSSEAVQTTRGFGTPPELAAALSELALRTSELVGIKGYARVDFRVDFEGRPTILEINPNPSLDPDAGFAAAAREAGLSYESTILRILDAALGA